MSKRKEYITQIVPALSEAFSLAWDLARKQEQRIHCIRKVIDGTEE